MPQTAHSAIRMDAALTMAAELITPVCGFNQLKASVSGTVTRARNWHRRRHCGADVRAELFRRHRDKNRPVTHAKTHQQRDEIKRR